MAQHSVLHMLVVMTPRKSEGLGLGLLLLESKEVLLRTSMGELSPQSIDPLSCFLGWWFLRCTTALLSLPSTVSTIRPAHANADANVQERAKLYKHRRCPGIVHVFHVVLRPVEFW